jgi:hypothetical protein
MNWMFLRKKGFSSFGLTLGSTQSSGRSELGTQNKLKAYSTCYVLRIVCHESDVPEKKRIPSFGLTLGSTQSSGRSELGTQNKLKRILQVEQAKAWSPGIAGLARGALSSSLRT